MRLPISSEIRRCGFSVIELIVALVVVAALSVFALGVVGKIREQTKPTREIRTMRELGVVLHLYIAENRGALPQNQQPMPVKTLAHYLGYTKAAEDWSNDSATPRNSIFRNEADETAIRKTFASAYAPAENADPINAFATNAAMGLNPNNAPENYDALSNVRTYLEIKRPNEKIYMVPTWFMPTIQPRFSEATTTNPFRTTRNSAEKGHFPALFADGHVAMVDPAPAGITLNQINFRWIRPKHE